MFKSFLISTMLILFLGTGLFLYTKNRTKKPLDIQLPTVNENLHPETKPAPEEPKIVENKIYTNFKEAMDASKTQNKPVFVFFEADWCVYCKKMKANILELEEVKTKLNKDYVVCFIDTNKDRQTTKNFKVKTIPACLVVSSDGTILARNSGLKSKEEFLNWLAPKDVSFTE